MIYNEAENMLQILTEARNRIATEGWIVGDFFGYEGKGGYCALGGIARAINHDLLVAVRDGTVDEVSSLTQPYEVYRQAASYLMETIVQRDKKHWPASMMRNCSDLVPEWNDAPGRTKEEVLQGFDWAIERLEKEFAPEVVEERELVLA